MSPSSVPRSTMTSNGAGEKLPKAGIKGIARATTMPLRLGRQRSIGDGPPNCRPTAGADAPVRIRGVFGCILSGPRGQTSTISSAAAAEVRAAKENREGGA